jgi:hypothetical protein
MANDYPTGPMTDRLLVGMMALDTNTTAAEMLRRRLAVTESLEDCRRLASRGRQMVGD